MCPGSSFSFKITTTTTKSNRNHIFVNSKIFKKYFNILLLSLFCSIVDLKNKKPIYRWKALPTITRTSEACLKGTQIVETPQAQEKNCI